jgi:hypothetical protein
MLGRPRRDVGDEILRGRAGAEQSPDAARPQRLHVLGGYDAAARDQDVGPAHLVQQLAHAGEQGHVRAGQDREADDVHVLLHRRRGDHLRRLMEPGVDHFHAGVPQRGRDDLGAAVVAVEARLGDEHADRSGGGGHGAAIMRRVSP